MLSAINLSSALKINISCTNFRESIVRGYGVQIFTAIMVNYTLFAGFGSCSSKGVDGAECPESSSVSSRETASVVSESEMDPSIVII